MKVSRAPEKRGGANKALVYISLIIAAVVVGVLVTYLTTGFASPSATGDQTGAPQVGAGVPSDVSQLEPTPVPPPTATPVPTVTMKMLETEPESLPQFIPDVDFGEVLAEGFVDVELPANRTAQSWYTFQVDTVSRDITLFFAIYNDSLNTITRTVKIEGYSWGADLDNAEVTLSYPEGPDRVIVFDRGEGTMTLTQQIQQPHGPSMFSSELRVGLVNQRMVLKDETGAIGAELQLDLTGLSDSEVIVFKRSAPAIVEDVLLELEDLVQQIEAKRTR